MPYQRVASVRWRVTLNNQELPVTSLRVHRGAYGSVGTFEATTAVLGSDLNIYSIAAGNGTGGRSQVDLQVSTDDGQTFKSLMTGDLDEITWDYDKDEAKLSGRDFAGRLIESRVILKGSQYTNQVPSAIAKEFAKDAGLTPNVQAVAGEQPIGYLGENNLAVRTATPITKWALLVLMARLTGRTVSVTPGNPPGLFFGVVNQNATPTVYTWGAVPKTPNVVPCRELRGEWRPFKNSTFQVFVISYHPQKDATHVATVVVAGETIQYEAPTTIKAGRYAGAAGASARLHIGSLLEDKPAYIYYMHGKTAQECQTNAEAIAREISKREFLMHATVDGDTTLNPLGLVQIQQPLNLSQVRAFDSVQTVQVDPLRGRLFYVSSIEHCCDMREGFVTRFDAFHLPSEVAPITALKLPATPVTAKVPIE